MMWHVALLVALSMQAAEPGGEVQIRFCVASPPECSGIFFGNQERPAVLVCPAKAMAHSEPQNVRVQAGSRQIFVSPNQMESPGAAILRANCEVLRADAPAALQEMCGVFTAADRVVAALNALDQTMTQRERRLQKLQASD